MKSNWWKILSIILLSWSLVAGLIVPLRTGITTVSPTQIKVGESVNLKVEGYNSAWGNAQKAVAWLHVDSTIVVDLSKKKFEIKAFAIKSKAFKAIDDRHLEFAFDIPRHLPLSTKLENASILVEVEGNDQAIRPDVLVITQDSINALEGIALWTDKMDIHREWKFSFPYRNILYETIRNTFFHVPMWFVMFTLFGIAIYYGIQFLRTRDLEMDVKAVAFTQTGVLFGFLGLFSGALWANYTWGEPFPMDIKIIMTYTCLAIYLAYFVLRAGFESHEQRARVAAVYSIFAFSSLVPLLYIVPRLAADSLHPANGGNIAFGSQDLDNTMRLIFYPASLGWILMGIWIATLVFRMDLIKERILANN